MEITYFNLFGFVLIYSGVHGFIKGKIEWSVEVGPGGGRSKGMFNIDLTPDRFKASKGAC